LGPGYCLQALFDSCVVPEENRLRIWLSWRDLHSIALSESADGARWTAPRIVLERDATIEWEKDDVNRPHVLSVNGTWYMWYTGQNRAAERSAIGLVTSPDGEHWERVGTNPVMEPAGGWEKNSIMCPHVLYDNGRFRMWYSGGEMYEPDALGYAESDDGIDWRREPANPIFRPAEGWESDRVTAACIVPARVITLPSTSALLKALRKRGSAWRALWMAYITGNDIQPTLLSRLALRGVGMTVTCTSPTPCSGVTNGISGTTPAA
jgi:hypothetical protein